MPLPPGVYRADHIGSLLRPAPVLAARRAHDANLRAVEDAQIAASVRRQLSAGLRSITDGEFRRAWFHVDFLQRLGGIEFQGHVQSTNTTTHGVTPPRLVVTGKVVRSEPVQLADYEFLQRRLDSALAEVNAEAGNGGGERAVVATAKVCIPSPTMAHFRGDLNTLSAEAYPPKKSPRDADPLEAFFADLAAAYRAELAALYEAGCRFVQLDDTNLAYLCDEGMRAAAETRHGSSATELTEKYVGLINAALRGRPAGLTVGVHLCRGNYRSQWFAQGGYEPVAEVLLQKLDVDVYFLEYDDARSGDFAPLRFLPEGKVVVLGVMSSKVREIEEKEVVVRRLKEAAGYVKGGLDQLCLSHQCGFSSTEEGNDLSQEEQWKKVEAMVAIAKEVWGEDLSV